MNLERFMRHVMMSPMKARRAFPPETIDAIQREIALQEKRHSGEICFVVEAELGTGQLWRDVDARARAREVFALQGVWNTEDNNGVLVYVLLADRHVEIVADRGIDGRVGAEDWQRIVQAMNGAFREGRFEEAAIAGVRAVSDLIAGHFPSRDRDANELPDRPLIL